MPETGQRKSRGGARGRKMPRSARRHAAAAVRLAAGLMMGLAAATGARAQQAPPRPAAPVVTWDIPAVDQLPDDEQGRLVRYGRSLVMATYAHIGPEVADPAKRLAGNNLACTNCHLGGGTKKFGLPLIGTFGDYPAYSARSGAEATIEDRLNGCMTRSMNGRPFPQGSRELAALTAYLKVLSTGIKPDAEVIGHGAGSIAELTRAADPVRGERIYLRTCAECHGVGGRGVRRGLPGDALGYMVPPLWGEDSYNDGAGMARLITIANFVHSNMPNGTSWVDPALDLQDAWDVGAYVNSQPRPKKADLAADFPDKLLKPVDTPYGPYADGFSQRQHTYGPFGPITAEIDRLKAEQAAKAAGGTRPAAAPRP